MSSKFFGFIDKRPLIWFHYLPLTGVVFLAHYLSVNRFFNLETISTINPWFSWLRLAAWYYLFLLVGDNIIHKIIGED